MEVNSKWQNKKDTLVSDRKSIVALEKQQQECESTIVQLEKQVEKGLAASAKQETVVAQDAESLADTQKQLQSLAAGMAASGDQNTSLVEELAEKQRELNSLATLAQKKKMEATHLKKGIVEKTKTLQSSKKGVSSLQASFDKASKQLTDLQTKVQGLNFDGSHETELQQQKSELETKVYELQNKSQRLEATLSARLQFSYSDPERGFDRSKVKGIVAKLVEVKEPEAASALEVVAGGRLYQVVVDTAQTGKQLLEKGKLRSRVTIVPLDKVQSNPISQSKIQAAKNLSATHGGTVNSALSLIGYPDELKTAMEFIFGNALICDSIDLAKTITFNKNVRVRTVTLDGDSFDPQGTLSGGSRANSAAVLMSLQELSEVNRELGQNQAELTQISKELSTMSKSSGQWESLSQQLEIKTHEVELLQNRLSESSYGRLEQEVNDMAASLQGAETDFETAQADEKTSKSRVQELQKEIKEQEASRKSQTAKLEKAITQTKKTSQASVKKLKELQQAEEVVKLEQVEAAKEKTSIIASIEQATTALQKVSADEETLRDKVVSMREQYETARASLQEKKDELAQCDEELKDLHKKETKVAKKLDEIQLELKKMEQKIARFEKDEAAARKFVDLMITKHPWITTEKQFFGRPHTDYSFDECDISVAQKRLKELQDEQVSLSKKINKKVMGMIEKAEQEYKGLIQKRTVIENDRAKIEKVIQELDEKKNEALHKTWVKVNMDFGSIFCTLLPGTSAKLEPPEGGSVTDGLEVKVAFDGTWKQSLTELSGGQRSLLALSLILAMLLFKPAPMYILDEVDAALDLSHTQNIGQMLRTHFQHSQFIVVSLKEGMFNNANVVFRTKFVDGVSTVTRTVGKAGKSGNENEEPSKKRGKSQKTNVSMGRALQSKN